MNGLNLGFQPLCNRFLEKGNNDEFVNAMHLVQDKTTGLVGIKTPAHAEEMQTKYKWLSETEPTNHFKSVAKTIEKLSGLNGKSMIFHHFDTLFLKETCVFLAFPGFWQALPGKEIQFTPKSLFCYTFTIGFGRSAWRRNPGHGFVSFFSKLVTVLVAGSRCPAHLIGPRRCPAAT